MRVSSNVSNRVKLDWVQPGGLCDLHSTRTGPMCGRSSIVCDMGLCVYKLCSIGSCLASALFVRSCALNCSMTGFELRSLFALTGVEDSLKEYVITAGVQSVLFFLQDWDHGAGDP